MYTPKHFLEDRTPVLHEIMRSNSFATLVTHGPGRMMASHLPFLVDDTRGELGTLRAHMAHANPQWQDFAGGTEALVIFAGPHAYISPSWYGPGPRTPTWDYLAVHAYGTAVILDPPATMTLLHDLVSTYESSFPRPWTLDTQSAGHIEALAKGIVAFEIEISRLEGKAKMSQNRPADQPGVAAALDASGDPVAAAVAREIRARTP
ncbi:MAG: FMN-binding negative transcriptional regulator [Chloroflexi bacterium]|nr:FMN-binding negative transcriptional regulator [Chloroflexota bacterium]